METSWKTCTTRLTKLVVKGFASNCHQRLIHFPYEKDRTSSPRSNLTPTPVICGVLHCKCLILLVGNFKCIFLKCLFFVPTDFTPTFLQFYFARYLSRISKTRANQRSIESCCNKPITGYHLNFCHVTGKDFSNRAFQWVWYKMRLFPKNACKKD